MSSLLYLFKFVAMNFVNIRNVTNVHAVDCLYQKQKKEKKKKSNTMTSSSQKLIPVYLFVFVCKLKSFCTQTIHLHRLECLQIVKFGPNKEIEMKKTKRKFRNSRINK